MNEIKGPMRLVAAMLFALLSLVIPAWSQLNMKPGNWEFTTTMEGPMVPQPPEARTETRCVTEAETDPIKLMRAEKNCKITRAEGKGDTMEWALECPNPGGAAGKLTGTGKATATGTTASGEMTLSLTVAGKNMDMKTKWSGKRIGDCPQGK